MNHSKPHINYHLVAGLAVVIVGLVIEKLIEHLSREAFLLTIALALLSIILTAVIGHSYGDSLITSISENMKSEIKNVVESRLESHMKAISELSAEAVRAAVYLQASNSSSDLRKILLTAVDITEMERNSKEKIFVVTRDLAFDQQIESTVIHNLRQGKEYYYFHPEGSISSAEVNNYKMDLALDRESLKGVIMIAIPRLEFTFATDLVVYDPHKKTRVGYVRLPTDGLPGGVRAILLKESDSLRDINESLNLLLKRHRPEPTGLSGRDESSRVSDSRTP